MRPSCLACLFSLLSLALGGSTGPKGTCPREESSHPSRTSPLGPVLLATHIRRSKNQDPLPKLPQEDPVYEKTVQVTEEMAADDVYQTGLPTKRLASVPNCTNAPGAMCMCPDTKFPCWRAFRSSCACWAGVSPSVCRQTGGTYCTRFSSCTPNCAVCRSNSSCYVCNSGYMLVAGGCTARPVAYADQWVRVHNVVRCMHGVPNVVWSPAVAADASAYVNTIRSLVHSKSYQVPPPAGPAGENLAQGFASLQDSANAWYQEVSCCNWTTGCFKGSCEVGHFTAMVWAGVLSIGCARNKGNIDICRYWSGNTVTVNTANLLGSFTQMVRRPKYSVADCIRWTEGNATTTTTAPAANSSSGPSNGTSSSRTPAR